MFDVLGLVELKARSRYISLSEMLKKRAIYGIATTFTVLKDIAIIALSIFFKTGQNQACSCQTTVLRK